MKKIVRSTVITFALLFWGTAHAYMTAGELALTCAKGEMKRDGKTVHAMENAACNLLFAGYRDGMVDGTLRGATAVYVHDPRVFAEVEGVKDLNARITPVVAISRCGVVIGDDSSLEDLKRAFVSYVGDHPNLSSKGYQSVVAAAIDAKLCGK